MAILGNKRNHDAIGASHTDGQTMAKVSVLPFGGALSIEVAYVADGNLDSNMHTAERMEAFTRNLLFPTVTTIVEAMVASERLWLEKQTLLAADTSIPEDRRYCTSTVAVPHAAAARCLLWTR